MEATKNIETPTKGYLDEIDKKKNALLSIIIYIASMYVFNLIIQVLLMAISPLITGIELYQINELGKKILTPENEEFINSWTQILVYGVMAIGLIAINLSSYKNDFLDFKNNFKKLFLEIPIGFGIFYGIALLGSLLLSLLNISDSSANQDSLEQLVLGNYGLIVLFSIIIVGPICEEIIFRQSAFRLFKKETKPLKKIIFSGVIFGLIHISSAIIIYFSKGQFSLIPKELLLGIPYVLQGMALSYVYYRSNENIIPVTVVHILNNLLAGILVFIPMN